MPAGLSSKRICLEQHHSIRTETSKQTLSKSKNRSTQTTFCRATKPRGRTKDAADKSYLYAQNSGNETDRPAALPPGPTQPLLQTPSPALSICSVESTTSFSPPSLPRVMKDDTVHPQPAARGQAVSTMHGECDMTGSGTNDSAWFLQTFESSVCTTQERGFISRTKSAWTPPPSYTANGSSGSACRLRC